MLTSAREGRQLCLFEHTETALELDTVLWCHTFDRQDSTLQALSPYSNNSLVTKIQALLHLYSHPGAIVLDPFSGSGRVPLEAAMADRRAWASDVNPYAYTLTRGKLEAPRSERIALQQAMALLEDIELSARSVDLDRVPLWVQGFFHPETLRELLVVFQRLRQQPNYFLTACLLGILHHVHPGYLSYPTNLQAPYLRRVSYSPEEFPHLYNYRDVRSRLFAKIKRSYRRHQLPSTWEQRHFQVWQTSATQLAIADEMVDTVISNPPHVGAFDVMRDQRLRLWFLGYEDWATLNATLISNQAMYRTQMPACLSEIVRVLKPGGYCVWLLDDVQRGNITRGTAELLAAMALEASQNHLVVETLYDRPVSKPRRSSANVRAIKLERILVMRKVH